MGVRKYNKYDLTGSYGIGYTTNTNEPFYFDLEDYDKIKDYCWKVHRPKPNYVRIVADEIGGIKKTLFLHSVITGYTRCDHINHNTFDNRKANLREVTHQENMRNQRKSNRNTSGFIGVSWRKDRNKWTVRIHDNEDKYLSLGCYTNIEDAVKVRLQAELDIFGPEFAPQRDLFEEYGIIPNKGGDL